MEYQYANCGVSLFPEVLDCISDFGVTGLTEDGLIISKVLIRAYAVDKHGSVDDRPYGGTWNVNEA